MFGPASLFFYGTLAWLAPVVLLVLVAMALAMPRQRPDPHGRRPFAIYIFSVMLVSLFTALTATGMVAAALAGTITGTGVGGGVQCTSEATFRSSAQTPPQESTEASPPAVYRPRQVEPSFGPEEFEQEFRGRTDRLRRPEGDLPRPLAPLFDEDVLRQRCEPTGSVRASGALALRGMFLMFTAGVVLIFHAGEAQLLLSKEGSDG